MDILQYSGGSPYQQGRKTDLGVSVEDLAYSMRQDIFQQQQQQQQSNFHHSDSHSSIPDTSSYNTNGHNNSSINSSGHSSSVSPPSSESYGLSPVHHQTQQEFHQSMEGFHQSPNGYNGMDYNTQNHSQQSIIENRHVVEQVTFKKSAKTFYQELYGQPENNNSVSSLDTTGQRSSYNTSYDGDSPRMLPKPPMEPRGSKTRSSLRRAAKALLNRSRQNLTDSEERSRKPEKPVKPMKPTKPASEGSKLKRSGSIRERLQKNKNKMGELLKAPSFLRRGSLDNYSPADAQTVVSANHNSFNPNRGRYTSTEHIHPDDDIDDSAPVAQHRSIIPNRPPQHKPRYSSAENLRSNYGHSSNESLPQNSLQTYGHPRLIAHSSTSDLDSQNSGSDTRCYGNRELPRSASPGYQLRRHSSGPVYRETSPRERETVKRGYHTADSDTDSSISRNDGYMPQSNRHDTRRPLPSTRDTLRMLQKKKREVTGQPRGMIKVQSGPLRADHNIQMRKEESSPRDVSMRDPWLEQGARPKHTQSTESLETEEVRHEVLPDSIISVDSEQEQSSQDNGRMSRVDSSVSSRSTGSNRQRAPSPSRSVHFEDPNSPRQYRTSNSRVPSRSAERSPTEHRHKSKLNNNPNDNRRSSSSDIVTPPHSYRDNVQDTNRNNSGYVNPVADLHHGSAPYIAQNGGSNISGNSNDSRGTQRKQHGNHGNVDDSGYSQVGDYQPASRGRTPASPNYNQYRAIDSAAERLAQRVKAPSPSALDKSRKRASSQPPPSNRVISSLKHSGSRESIASSAGSNPCIVVSDADDDSIMQIGSDIDDRPRQHFMSDLDNYSDISSSRLSISSRTSVSEKVQNVGRATKKKFNSMRKALSLDRLDKTGKNSDEQDAGGYKLKKSPSMRSLTSLLGGKKKSRKSDSGDDCSSKLEQKHRSASVIGLYNRPQRSTPNTDVTLPSHGRKVGRLLSRDPDGSQVVELVKPPAGPFGFYIARGTYDFGTGIFVTRLGDGHPAKILAGLLGIGDEILEINGENLRNKPIDDVYDIMMDNNTLVLKIMPLMARKK